MIFWQENNAKNYLRVPVPCDTGKFVFIRLTHVKVTHLLLIGPDRHVIIHREELVHCCHAFFFFLFQFHSLTFVTDSGHHLTLMTFQQLSFSQFNFTSTKPHGKSGWPQEHHAYVVKLDWKCSCEEQLCHERCSLKCIRNKCTFI